MQAWRYLWKKLHAKKWRCFWCSSFMIVTKQVWARTLVSYISASKKKILKRCGDFFNFPEEWTSFFGSGWNIWNNVRMSFILRGCFFVSFFIFSPFSPTFHAITLSKSSIWGRASSRRDVVHGCFTLELHLCPGQSGIEDLVVSLL